MVLALGKEAVPRMLEFGQENGSTFPILMDDTTYQAYEDPGPGNYALEVVVDREGIVRFAEHGSTVEELRGVIEPLLAE